MIFGRSMLRAAKSQQRPLLFWLVTFPASTLWEKKEVWQDMISRLRARVRRFELVTAFIRALA